MCQRWLVTVLACSLSQSPLKAEAKSKSPSPSLEQKGDLVSRVGCWVGSRGVGVEVVRCRCFAFDG